MKILKSWLKDFVAADISDEKLVEILTLAGLDVEEIVSGVDGNIIVGEIKSIKSHPDADKLRVAVVGSGKEDLQIVCGAPNIAVGQRVPLALPGSYVSNVEIKSAKIRGIESQGMMCSQNELGLGDDHAGIYILPAEYEVGKRLADYLSEDSIINLDVTANRGDCLSHLGIAREIAAAMNLSVKKEPVALKKTLPDHASTKISLEIKKSELCPQYLARVIGGLKIGPSPKWLKDRLIACGAKPINNVVDVTNYILLDLGHPLHAFDWKKIKKSKIIVRAAKRNEDIITLDGEVRNLNPQMLVIADNSRPIAIAGVMGGKNSEVDEATETVVLEAAEFDRKNIRETSKALGLSTEASYRFERGIDSGVIEYAINKAANLIVSVAGGRIMQGIVQEGEKPTHIEVPIEYEKICQLLGQDIELEEINHILRHLGLTISDGIATVPTWRHDISIWQDLAEEVGRIVGYDKIKPQPLPKIKAAAKTVYYFSEVLKDILTQSGYTETMNYPFLSEDDVKAAKLDSKNLLEIANPIQPENKYLRNSLVPGMLKNIAKNPSFDPILIFEVGHVFTKGKEYSNLGVATAGKSLATHDEVVAKIAYELEATKTEIKTLEFNRDELSRYKIKKPAVIVSEINLSKFVAEKKIDQDIKLKIAGEKIIYRGVSKYPSVTRDLAFIVGHKVDAATVAGAIYELSELINRVELFDEFASEKFGAGKKNIAFHLYLQSKDKTLNDAEAESIIRTIVKAIERKFSAKLRKA